jgi:hypothetical protein
MKCLEKKPQDRYPSAGAVSKDLNRFLNGEPITARPPNAIVKLRYWIKKHPKLISRTFGALAAFILIAMMGFWWQSEQAKMEAVISAAVASERASVASQKASVEELRRSDASLKAFEAKVERIIAELTARRALQIADGSKNKPSDAPESGTKPPE